MEKHVKLKHIASVSSLISGFKPISESINATAYKVLTNRLENFKRWPESEKITRQEFEREIHNDPELIDAYLAAFSKIAIFYRCIIVFNDKQFPYYIMCNGKHIVMMYHIRDIITTV